MNFKASVAFLSIGTVLAAGSCTSDTGSPPIVDDDSPGSSGATLTTGGLDSSSSGFEPLCLPGEVRCADDKTLETCDATGLSWTATECDGYRTCGPCDGDDGCEFQCAGPCESETELGSSAGCSFLVNRTLHRYVEFPDGVVVGNPNEERVATVEIYKILEGQTDEELVETVTLDPSQSYAFDIDSTFAVGTSSVSRTGGMYRISSDVPVIAYHHAPNAVNFGNDSSLLLPNEALRQDYVVMSFTPAYNRDNLGQPTFFEVIALDDDTTVEFWPTAETAGNGLPIDPVPAGGHGTEVLNKYDTLRITAALCPGEEECPIIYPKPFGDGVPTDETEETVTAESEKVFLQDLSGTVIKASKPIWVMGASRCSRVPVRHVFTYTDGRCNHLQELMIPLDYWGTEYVAAPAPRRPPADPFVAGAPEFDGDEEVHWRIYAGADNIELTFAPMLPGIDCPTLDERGDFCEIASLPQGSAFVVHASGPVMPVQYLQSARSSGETTLLTGADAGDPSMTQTIPTTQWLSRYVFVTPIGFFMNYVQVIRRTGGAEVRINGDVIPDADFVGSAGEYEWADRLIEEGSYSIESADPFGIIQYGFHHGTFGQDKYCVEEPCTTSYSYPGGMQVDEIYIP